MQRVVTYSRPGLVWVFFALSCFAENEPRIPAGRAACDLRVSILERFHEESDLRPLLQSGGYKVIYRFFAVPTERHAEPFILRIAVKPAISPIQAGGAHSELKVLRTDSLAVIKQSGKLDASDTEKLLMAIQRSEIFHLTNGTADARELDDGGSYLIFSGRSDYTFIFERTTVDNIISVERMSATSLPAHEAGSAFTRIADSLFREIKPNKKSNDSKK